MPWIRVGSIRGPAGPAGVIILEVGQSVPPGTPIGTIVYRKQQ